MLKFAGSVTRRFMGGRQRDASRQAHAGLAPVTTFSFVVTSKPMAS
jgi:hypothetical protein